MTEPRIQGLHHVQLAAPPGAEDAARKFWGGILGMVEVDKPALLARRGGVWFQSGSVELHIGVEDAFAPARKAHPAFVVGDLDATARDLEESGFPVRWDDALSGYRRFHSEDPFGNRLELLGLS